jgi:hypothetical protein
MAQCQLTPARNGRLFKMELDYQFDQCLSMLSS